MVRLTWSRRALCDVDGIAEFIAMESPRYARETVHRIRERVKPLRKQPRLGRIVPEKEREDVREVFSDPYRIIYQIKLDEILVVHVRQMSRSLEAKDIRETDG